MITSSELCEFLTAFVAAALVWLFGYRAFLTGQNRSAPVNSAPLPGKFKEDANAYNMDFLIDLVKWAEMLMQELEDARRVQEKKALLIMSLSFAIIGYLSSNISVLRDSWGIGWFFIAYLPFGMAVFWTMKTIDFAIHYPRGEHPANFRKVLAEDQTKSEEIRKWTMYYMLESYRKKLDPNWNINLKKMTCLHRAKYSLIFGAGIMAGMAVVSGEKIAEICCWLTK